MPIPGWEGKYSATADGRVWSHLNDMFLSLCNDGDGYSAVTLRKEGRQFCARVHRLVYSAFNPLSPNQPIDHVDRNRKNNAIDNLRACSNSENQHNTEAWATNTSGFKGVSPNANGDRWVAAIKVKGVTKGVMHLGTFDSPVEAASFYANAAKRLVGNFTAK